MTVETNGQGAEQASSVQPHTHTLGMYAPAPHLYCEPTGHSGRQKGRKTRQTAGSPHTGEPQQLDALYSPPLVTSWQYLGPYKPKLILWPSSNRVTVILEKIRRHNIYETQAGMLYVYKRGSSFDAAAYLHTPHTCRHSQSYIGGSTIRDLTR